jgi:DNA-binding winged helix-turn-helix (wHTH) protein
VAALDQTDPSEYRFGDVRVDTRARLVLKAGVEVPLEPKAYEVLLVLLREPQAAVSRDRLLDAVWGHRFTTPAVLNRVIAMLRRELGDDADHPRLIRTVHGIGYSFIGMPADGAPNDWPDSSVTPVPQPMAIPSEPEPATRPWKRHVALGFFALLSTVALLVWWSNAPDLAPAVPTLPGRSYVAATPR